MFAQFTNFIGRHLALVLLSVLAIRSAFLGVVDLDLLGDESYYWDWSRQLDWCYYSKPPMIAWLVALFTWVGGDNVFAVRFPATVLGTVSLGYLFAMTKELYGVAAASIALLIMLAMPSSVLVNFLMTIDAPLTCFWMMSLYYLQRALFAEDKNAWLWAGMATAMALLSKQVAILIPMMLLTYVLFRPGRHHWLKHGFLLYMMPVGISLVPILWWNQQHDWVMFRHSGGHFGTKENFAGAGRLQGAAEFVAYQLLLATPVLFAMMVSMSIKKMVDFAKLDDKGQFLLLMGPVLLIATLGLSLMQKVQGNWSTPFYYSGIILLAGQGLTDVWMKWLKIGIVVGCVMVLLTYALPLSVQLLPIQNTAFDPTVRFKAWQQIAQVVEKVRQEHLADTKHSPLITVGHRFLTSELAFYLPDHPRVYRYEASGQITSQYEVWQGAGTQV